MKKKFKLIKVCILIFLGLQFLLFIFVKQSFTELERKNKKLEQEIKLTMNENNILKVRLTTIQSQITVRKLVEKYLKEYKHVKPSQVIEKSNI